MHVSLDSPLAGALCDPLALRVEGWLHGGDAHAQITAVEIRADGHLVGLTHVLTLRADVNAALSVSADSRTGFQFEAQCPAAAFDAPLTLTLHAILADGTHTPALVERAVRTVARDYRRNHFGVLLDATTIAIQQRTNASTVAPSASGPALSPPPLLAAPPAVVKKIPARLDSPAPLPTTPRAGPKAHPYLIRDFFTLRDTLFGRGIVEHAPDDPPAVLVRLWDGSLLPVVISPDRVETSGPGRTCFHFAHAFHHPVTGENLRHCSLIVAFRSDHLLIEHPGEDRLAADRFANSETLFAQAVQNHPTARIIEIGARARSGISRRDLFPPTAAYTGFDIADGPNVDVVGDAHELSRHFPANHFDFAFSVSVWEHLVMPWKVSLELNRIMKPGGIVMINTHQTWPSHEEPWDFFRFSEYSWASLFNPATGFEIIAVGHGSPAVMAAALPQPHLQDQNIDWHYGFLASRVVARKIGDTTLSWPVPTSLVSQGLYPH